MPENLVRWLGTGLHLTAHLHASTAFASSVTKSIGLCPQGLESPRCRFYPRDLVRPSCIQPLLPVNHTQRLLRTTWLYSFLHLLSTVVRRLELQSCPHILYVRMRNYSKRQFCALDREQRAAGKKTLSDVTSSAEEAFGFTIERRNSFTTRATDHIQ
jgi:hypothetical protein